MYLAMARVAYREGYPEIGDYWNKAGLEEAANQLRIDPTYILYSVFADVLEILKTGVYNQLAEATSPDGLDIGNRRVTISTVGIPGGIDKMTAADLPYKLAVSLHAADDRTRSEIIPQNRFFGIRPILAAAERYFQKTGRRVTFEYILIAGVNDSAADARRLTDLLNRKTAIVNIIPYNPVPELPWKAPSTRATIAFVRALEEGGIQVKVRFRKGDGINAACGQLRRSYRAPEEE